MINQKPQRVFFSRWGFGLSRASHLDSTFAASDSHTFIRYSRRSSRPISQDGYRYDVFQVTLRHLDVYLVEFNSNLNLVSDPTLLSPPNRNAKRDFLWKRCRYLYSRSKIRFPNLICPMIFFY